MIGRGTAGAAGAGTGAGWIGIVGAIKGPNLGMAGRGICEAGGSGLIDSGGMMSNEPTTR